jgi:hypothetical protein
MDLRPTSNEVRGQNESNPKGWEAFGFQLCRSFFT